MISEIVPSFFVGFMRLIKVVPEKPSRKTINLSLFPPKSMLPLKHEVKLMGIGDLPILVEALPIWTDTLDSMKSRVSGGGMFRGRS